MFADVIKDVHSSPCYDSSHDEVASIVYNVESDDKSCWSLSYLEVYDNELHSHVIRFDCSSDEEGSVNDYASNFKVSSYVDKSHHDEFDAFKVCSNDFFFDNSVSNQPSFCEHIHNNSFHLVTTSSLEYE